MNRREFFTRLTRALVVAPLVALVPMMLKRNGDPRFCNFPMGDGAFCQNPKGYCTTNFDHCYTGKVQ